jgi:hypothetical protein
VSATREDTTAEFLGVARQAFASSEGDAALDALGWWDLLPHLHDPELRPAAFAVFRAQGGALGSSAALGGLLAQPYLEDTHRPAASVLSAVRRTSKTRGDVWVLVGDQADRAVLIDQPGQGAMILEVEQVELQRVDIPGQLRLHEVNVDLSAFTATIDESVAAPARVRSTFIGRIALALEILGAAEQALELAVDYAGQREQFGQAIGGFQAVRHLLAWAKTDVVALESATGHAVRLGANLPTDFGAVVKALAGRNGRRACERSLQVLGGIGFTTEFDHHHFHSRVMALDALLGSTSALTRELGAALRETRQHPGYPASLLLTEQ